MKKYKLTPNHQFGFQPKHVIIEQTHRIIKKINNNIGTKRYYTAVCFTSFR